MYIKAEPPINLQTIWNYNNIIMLSNVRLIFFLSLEDIQQDSLEH